MVWKIIEGGEMVGEIGSSFCLEVGGCKDDSLVFLGILWLF